MNNLEEPPNWVVSQCPYCNKKTKNKITLEQLKRRIYKYVALCSKCGRWYDISIQSGKMKVYIVE